MAVCRSCGSELPEGVAVCPKCGAAVEGLPPPPPGPVSRARTERREKGEKDEKGGRNEKREKDEKGEKGRGPDRFGSVVGGLVLILLGGIFFLAQSNYITWEQFGNYFMLGMGLILIAWAIVRYLTLPLKGPAMGLLIGGLILSLIGLSSLMKLGESWPFIFIALGAIIVIWSIGVLRRSPRPR
jgi:hypothetical protein